MARKTYGWIIVLVLGLIGVAGALYASASGGGGSQPTNPAITVGTKPAITVGSIPESQPNPPGTATTSSAPPTSAAPTTTDAPTTTAATTTKPVATAPATKPVAKATKQPATKVTQAPPKKVVYDDDDDDDDDDD